LTKKKGEKSVTAFENSIGDLVKLHQACVKAIQDGFGELLNNRHLYQHVDIDTNAIKDRIIKNPVLQHLTTNVSAMIEEADWLIIGSAGMPLKLHGQQLTINLPVVSAYCERCRGRFPSNQSPIEKSPPTMIRLNQAYQVFSIPLVCQNCRDSAVTFVIARARNRLTLVGRFPIEHIEVPAHFPKSVRSYYSDARLAFNSGQILPALFMLRTLIEQFMRSKVGDTFKRGDDLGKAYKETLPPAFKAAFSTLADSYESLSEALHSANADPDLFITQLGKIDEHFDARRLHKLDQLGQKTREVS
jgi:hypothetical protein